MTSSTSRRKTPLPPGWSSRIQPAILRRDSNRCYICGGYATEVDHIIPGENHDPSNLAAICKSCHATKTGREAQRASIKARLSRNREPERHPGLLD